MIYNGEDSNGEVFEDSNEIDIKKVSNKNSNERYKYL